MDLKELYGPDISKTRGFMSKCSESAIKKHKIGKENFMFFERIFSKVGEAWIKPKHADQLIFPKYY